MAARVAQLGEATRLLALDLAALRARVHAAGKRSELAGRPPPTPTPKPKPLGGASKAEVPKAAASKGPSIKLVVQRCDHAELLVDNDDEWIPMDKCLVVFVSFCKDFDISALPKAARSLLTIPLLLAEGVWGDGSAPQSVVALAAADNTPGVMIIPSAGLTSKIKGKGLQYRGQCDKETGKRLYHKFVGLLRSMSADLVAGVDPNTIAKSVKNLSLSDRDATPAANDAAGVVRVVAGTFGNRQGLRTTSECGPFTHMFEF